MQLSQFNGTFAITTASTFYGRVQRCPSTNAAGTRYSSGSSMMGPLPDGAAPLRPCDTTPIISITAGLDMCLTGERASASRQQNQVAAAQQPHARKSTSGPLCLQIRPELGQAWVGSVRLQRRVALFQSREHMDAGSSSRPSVRTSCHMCARHSTTLHTTTDRKGREVGKTRGRCRRRRRGRHLFNGGRV